jgi:hypothetical protein
MWFQLYAQLILFGENDEHPVSAPRLNDLRSGHGSHLIRGVERRATLGTHRTRVVLVRGVRRGGASPERKESKESDAGLHDLKVDKSKEMGLK